MSDQSDLGISHQERFPSSGFLNGKKPPDGFYQLPGLRFQNDTCTFCGGVGEHKKGYGCIFDEKL